MFGIITRPGTVGGKPLYFASGSEWTHEVGEAWTGEREAAEVALGAVKVPPTYKAAELVEIVDGEVVDAQPDSDVEDVPFADDVDVENLTEPEDSSSR
jgi:hypothetical protein